MQKSFTLIELIIVISIIAILASMGVFSYQSAIKNGRDARRKSDLEQIRAALEMYRSDQSKYPDAGNCANLVGPLHVYLPTMPSDPRDPTYTYNCSSSSVTSTYTVGAYLEGSNPPPDCGINCGISNCDYSVGPYGKTCGL